MNTSNPHKCGHARYRYKPAGYIHSCHPWMGGDLTFLDIVSTGWQGDRWMGRIHHQSDLNYSDKTLLMYQ